MDGDPLVKIIGEWDDKAARKTLTRLAQKPANRHAIAQAVNASAALVQRHAKIILKSPGSYRHSPAHALAQSISVIPDEARLHADVGPHAIEARIREFGGVIRPVHKRFLSWLMPASEVREPRRVVAQRIKRHVRKGQVITKGGELLVRVFAKKVTHPAQPYMRPAWAKAQAGIKKLFGDVINRLQGVTVTPPEL